MVSFVSGGLNQSSSQSAELCLVRFPDNFLQWVRRGWPLVTDHWSVTRLRPGVQLSISTMDVSNWAIWAFWHFAWSELCLAIPVDVYGSGRCRRQGAWRSQGQLREESRKDDEITNSDSFEAMLGMHHCNSQVRLIFSALRKSNWVIFICIYIIVEPYENDDNEFDWDSEELLWRWRRPGADFFQGNLGRSCFWDRIVKSEHLKKFIMIVIIIIIINHIV